MKKTTYPKEPSWLKAIRERAQLRFKQLGYPSRKQDAWKYMDLQSLQSTDFAETSSNGESTSKILNHGLKRWGILPSEDNLVFVNGKFITGDCLDTLKSKGIVFGSLKDRLSQAPEQIKTYLDTPLSKEQDPFFVLNTASFKEGAYLHCPDNTVLEKPLHVWFVWLEERRSPFAAYLRNLFILGKASKCKIMLHTVGETTKNDLANVVHQIHLEEDAKLKIIDFQNLPQNLFQMLSMRSTLSERSRFESTLLTGGACLSRQESQVFFKGKDAFASLKGLGLLNGQNQVFQQVSIFHENPRNTSKQLFKNILWEKSVSEFSGLVHVHRDAQATKSHQMNRNLLLSPEAHAYARPQFKIYADDVKCNHGATIGQLQDKEIFYLRSRGLSDRDARALLTYGFAEEILEDLEGDNKEFLEEFIQTKLSMMHS